MNLARIIGALLPVACLIAGMYLTAKLRRKP